MYDRQRAVFVQRVFSQAFGIMSMFKVAFDFDSVDNVKQQS